MCSKHLSRQCVISVKCMSHVMYCVVILKYSVFNDESQSSSVCNTRYTSRESFILSVYIRPRP